MTFSEKEIKMTTHALFVTFEAFKRSDTVIKKHSSQFFTFTYLFGSEKIVNLNEL